MCFFTKTVLVTIIVGMALCDDLVLVTRDEWNARPPKATEDLPTPVPYVVIHHSYIPPACTTPEECVKAVQWMQDFHQLNRSWNDIGYNFAIGGDGRVYIGRGWNAIGAHAPGYNNRSIGICIIGDWRTELPPANQLDLIKKLIELGMNLGYIQKDYGLVGHRQVREGTECPGDQLYALISKWDHFVDRPIKKFKPNKKF